MGSRIKRVLLLVGAAILACKGVVALSPQIPLLYLPSFFYPRCELRNYLYDRPDGLYRIEARVPFRVDSLPTGGCSVIPGYLTLIDSSGVNRAEVRTAAGVGSYEPDWRLDRVVLTPLTIGAKTLELRYPTTSERGGSRQTKHFNLTEAIRDGDVLRAAAAIEAGAEINASDARLFIPLHLAIAFGRSDILKLLIQKGARVDTEGFDGETPLQVAAEKSATIEGRLECLQLLIDNGLTADSEDALANPLMIRRSAAEIAFLLKHGARADASGAHTPLALASPDFEKLRLLWKPSHFGTAAWKGDESLVIRPLLERGVAGINFLIEMGVDPKF